MLMRSCSPSASEATGVPAVTLRAWERRHGFIKPHRTPKGHRLYTEEHIALIRRVLALLDAGIPVSRVGGIIRFEDINAQPLPDNDHWQVLRDQMLGAIAAFDELSLDRLYNDAMADYPLPAVTDKLIIPLLHRLGDNWHSGVSGVAEEHFFSLYVRNKLGSRWHHGQPAIGGRRIVVACVPGELHEYGLLFFALVARARGLDPVLLGASMPLNEIPRVVERTRACGVVLSSTMAPGWQVVERDMRELAAAVTVPVFIGGAGVTGMEETLSATGIRPVGADLNAGVEAIYRQLGEEKT